MSGDEAAWRDLIARYELPAVAETAPTPWPERENLPREPSPHLTQAPVRDPGPGQVDQDEDATGTDESGGPRAPDSDIEQGGPAQDNRDQGDLAPDTDAHDHKAPAAGPDLTRVVRHARPVQPPPAADSDDEDRYVPPPPPPLPRLDPVGKGAWTALFGGPGYLLIATFLNWDVPGLAALVAVAAFVGGFAVVIARMGDGPSRGDGPDNGAVV